MRRPCRIFMLLFWSLTGTPALAVDPGEILSDPQLESRARTISAELRCLVCQNQSIDDSDADLARDLRVLVRQRLKEGDTNDQIFDFVVARYGDFVMYRPPVRPRTWALWFGPVVFLGVGAVVFATIVSRRMRQPIDDADERDEDIGGEQA